MANFDTLDEFHRLIKRGDVIGIRKLIASGADVNFRYQFGWTPLMLAAEHGHTPIVRELLSAGADVQAVNILGFRRWLVLHQPARVPQFKCCLMPVHRSKFALTAGHSWNSPAFVVVALRHRSILSCCERREQNEIGRIRP